MRRDKGKVQHERRKAANMAHIRQSRQDSGLGFHVKFLETLKGVPSSLGSGAREDGGVNTISYNVLIKRFEKVNSPTKSSTYCSLLLIKTIS